MSEIQNTIKLPDWEPFVSRHHMTWSKKSCGWDSGAFLGNGLIGAMIYSAEDKTRRNTLRFTMGRTDVETIMPDRAEEEVYSRVPIGEVDMELDGWICDGTSMELDLYRAEFRGAFMTTKGRVSVRGLVHSLEDVMLIEADAEEEKVEFNWCPYSQIPEITKNEDGINYNQYIPKIELENRRVEDICVQMQRFGEEGKDGCAVAWKGTFCEDGKYRFYISICKGATEAAAEEAINHVKTAAGMEPELWIASHRSWWEAYYKKSMISCSDTQLEGFYLIQMYKLAAAARQDSPIMDNQGPWMAATPWPRAWFNMNVQMAYSPVYTSNHLEIGESLCRNLDSHMDSLIRNVPLPYQKDSAGLGRSAGCNLRSDVKDEVGNLTWVLHNYWRQYRYSMDDARLKEHLYPLLKRSVQYYIHLLKEGEDGKLHLPKMISPEYGSFRQLTVEDSTYDLSLLRWGCQTLLKASERLKLDDPDRAKWEFVLENLTDYPMDETGLMIGKDVPLAFGHRHFSHLLPIFPLHLMGGDSEEEKAFVHKCLRHWFHKEGDLRGFTFTGAASIAAAIGEGDEALAYLKTVLHLFKPNTMYKEAGPVIESPLAAAESIQDMLLQSWGEEIRVFPAVPEAWKDVTFHDLRAEGGFLVSAVRRGGETRWVRIKSLAGEPCVVRTDLAEKEEFCAETASGEALAVQRLRQGDLCLPLKAGEEAYLYAGAKPEFAIEPVKSQSHMEHFFGENKPWRLYGIPFED